MVELSGAAPLEPETVAAVRPVAGRLVNDILRSVRAASPVYADVLTGPEGVGIRLGIEQAIKSFLDAVERGERPGAETGEIWRRLGEAEFQAGRSLEDLREAFRTGVRAAWRGAAELASEAGVPTPSVIALAEAIFVYADSLTNDVVEGYLRTQSDEASERERRRRRLATLLLDIDGHDPEAIEHAAELARWAVPRSLALLALADESPGAIPRRLDIDVLGGSDQDGAFLVIPDPDGPGRAAALRRAVGSELAALGPTVAPRDAWRSLRWARKTLALAQSGAIDHHLPSPVRASEHLSALILLGDEELAAALASDRLAPLLELPQVERERLLQTLRAWLDHQRHTPRVAAELHVHPQTVRYRLGRLRELLGDMLDSPDGRFELQMALRALRALQG
jgi:PucR C-terminal helix-turn-helix domain